MHYIIRGWNLENNCCFSTLRQPRPLQKFKYCATMLILITNTNQMVRKQWRQLATSVTGDHVVVVTKVFTWPGLYFHQIDLQFKEITILHYTSVLDTGLQITLYILLWLLKGHHSPYNDWATTRKRKGSRLDSLYRKDSVLLFELPNLTVEPTLPLI